MTDRELIEQAKAGNSKAFEELVKRYEPHVAAVVVGMLGDRQEADDVGQEVFVRFYRSLDRFRGEAALGTYLTRIAINLSLNELKRRKRRRLLFRRSDEALQIASSDPEDAIASRETKALVQRAIQQLDPVFRSVLVLRLIEGYSTEETADLLGIPLGTVLSRLSRAQKRLKEILTPFVQEET